jgi:heme ABC exporter ATP-binding subunit CcmA
MNSNSATPFLEIRNVSKSFGRFHVLENINLQIASNDFISILGRNGAGKTTLLKIVSSLLKPTAGEVLFDGANIRDNLNSALRQIGVVSHQTFLYGDLTAIENLKFYAKSYDVDYSSIPPLLERVGLTHRANELTRRFSRGMQQRLSLARTLLHRPKLLLLDEPYTGLDPKAALFLDEILVEYHRQGNCILMISHDIEHSLHLANRVVVLDKGNVVSDKNVNEIGVDDFKSNVITQYMA